MPHGSYGGGGGGYIKVCQGRLLPVTLCNPISKYILPPPYSTSNMPCILNKDRFSYRTVTWIAQSAMKNRNMHAYYDPWYLLLWDI